jgi:hypothetical protein
MRSDTWPHYHTDLIHDIRLLSYLYMFILVSLRIALLNMYCKQGLFTNDTVLAEYKVLLIQFRKHNGMPHIKTTIVLLINDQLNVTMWQNLNLVCRLDPYFVPQIHKITQQ